MGDVAIALRDNDSNKQHYSQGWNARVNNEPYDSAASSDWKMGWRDCTLAEPEQRVLI